LLASVAESANTIAEAHAAVERGLSNPSGQSSDRQAVAMDLFYRPGGATGRSVAALLEVIELEPVRAAVPEREVQCLPSA